MASSSASGGLRDVLYLTQEDGSLVSTEERLYVHHRYVRGPPEVLYLQARETDPVRCEVLRSLQDLADLADLVGQSEGLICVVDKVAHVFYVCDAGTDRIVAEIPERYDDRPGFWGQATYGFGHSSRGFKILRYPYPHLREDDPIADDRPTILHTYHSYDETWVEGEYETMPICDPFREPAFRSPAHALLFWKVYAGDECRIIAYDLEDDSLCVIVSHMSFVGMPDANDDGDNLLRSIRFGLGCDGDIIGSRVSASGTRRVFREETANVQLFHLRFDCDNRWRIYRHSEFNLTLPSNTTMSTPSPLVWPYHTLLTPLVGLKINEDLQRLFFLLLEEKIICLNFRYDGIMWQALSRLNLDGPSPGFTAISLGPRIIPLDKQESGSSSSERDHLGHDHDRFKAPSPDDKTTTGKPPRSSKSQEQSTHQKAGSSLRQGISHNGQAPVAFSGFGDVTDEYIFQAAKLETHGAPACRSFSLEELKEATKDFDFPMCLGEGSMGKFYKGKLENGTSVAIRSLVISKKCSTQNLKVQLDSLSKLHHPHLVVLLGHCMDCSGQDDSGGNRLFLVYEYISGGNYRTYLSENHPEKVLKWPDRLAILIGVVKAVHFLHSGVIPGSFNNRLKTNNILLDKHRIPKLSDYGMSIITDETEKLEAKGEGPKSCRKKDLEDDVYNFGFILLESLIGPTVSGKGEIFLLNEMALFGSQDGRRRIVDPIVFTTCSQESLSIVVSITKKCLSPEVSTRPSVEDVLWNLQYAAQVQATADQKSDATI